MKEEDISELAELLREGLANGRRPHLTITSNSMSPLLRSGDQIILDNSPLSQLEPGDIISVDCHRYILTHRFWRKDNANIITRGDRPLQFDPPNPEEKYIGQAIIRKRNEKYLNIQRGFGKWLNKHLFWLAKMEHRLCLYIDQQSDSALAPLYDRWQAQLHRFLQLWGQFMTFFIDILATRKHSDR